MQPNDTAPVTVLLHEDARGQGHTTLSVWVGRNPGARGRAGTLVLRTDEWDELRTALGLASTLLHGNPPMRDSFLFEFGTLADAYPQEATT